MTDRKWRERKQRMEFYKQEQFDKRHHLLHVALHEAGHYVVADELGYPVFASIVPNERNEGRNNVFVPAAREGMVDQVAIQMAGEMAVMMSLGQRGLIVQNRGDLALTFAASWMHTMLERGITVQNPRESMASVTKFYHDNLDRIPNVVNEAARRLMNDAQPKVAEILGRCWEQVEQITDGLLKYKEVANEKMMALLAARDAETMSDVFRNEAAVKRRVPALAQLSDVLPPPRERSVVTQ